MSAVDGDASEGQDPVTVDYGREVGDDTDYGPQIPEPNGRDTSIDGFGDISRIIKIKRCPGELVDPENVFVPHEVKSKLGHAAGLEGQRIV